MNWESMRYLLAVVRQGTLLEAAKALQVSASTVTRRLRSLEEELGTTLFEKLKHGVALTEAGEHMLSVAESMSDMTSALSVEISGMDRQLSGVIRVSSTDSLMQHLLPDLAEFQSQYPDIQLELISTRAVSSLSQREADVAIRIAPQAPEYLIGRAYAQVAGAAYASVELLRHMGDRAELADYPWVGWDHSVNRFTDVWLQHRAPKAHINMRFTRMLLLTQAVASGYGATVLPTLIGDHDARLARIPNTVSTGKESIWVLTHPQLRGNAKVRAFMKAAKGWLKRDQDLIEGRRC